MGPNTETTVKPIDKLTIQECAKRLNSGKIGRKRIDEDTRNQLKNRYEELIKTDIPFDILDECVKLLPMRKELQKLTDDQIHENRTKIRGYKLEDIVTSEYNLSYVPKWVRDPKNLSFNDNMKNTGIYLWLNGHNVKKYLGRGTFGVVWQVENKAIKVAKSDSRKEWEDEVLTIQELNKLFENNEKAKKYLNISKTTEDSRVLESDLANEDIYQNQSKKGGLKADKTIASALRKSKQALKAVKFLHDAGYSHNDIKPTNMLKISKNSTKISKFDGKKHKSRLQITDFGQMTKFTEEPKPGSNGFLAPDWKQYDKTTPPKADKSISAKRDVYALGVTFLFFLFGRVHKFEKIKKISELLGDNKRTELDIYDKYVRKFGIYNGTSSKNFIKYLTLIKKMLAPNHNKRITLNKALESIKSLKFD